MSFEWLINTSIKSNVYLIGKSGKASPDCLQIPSAVTTNDACVKAKLTPAPGVCAQVCKF